MKVKFVELDLNYDVTYSTPIFSLADYITPISKMVYETIRKRFPFRVADIRLIDGESLADTHLEISLIGGNVLVKIYADKMTISASDIENRRQLTICQRCIDLCQEAILKAVPDLTISSVTLKPVILLDPDTSADDVDAYISKMQQTTVTHPLNALGGITQNFVMDVDVENAEENWNASIRVYLDRTKGEHDSPPVVLFCEIQYRVSKEPNMLEKQAEHSERLLNAFLYSIGMDTGSYKDAVER